MITWLLFAGCRQELLQFAGSVTGIHPSAAEIEPEPELPAPVEAEVFPPAIGPGLPAPGDASGGGGGGGGTARRSPVSIPEPGRESSVKFQGVRQRGGTTEGTVITPRGIDEGR